MKKTHTLSRDAKNISIWFAFILLLTAILLLISSVEPLLLIFFTEGEGIVVDKMNRSGPGSGLFVKVDNGTEVRIPPSLLWEHIVEGNFLIKKRFSFFYKIDAEEHNAFLYMMNNSLMMWGVLLFLDIVGIFYRNRNSQKK